MEACLCIGSGVVAYLGLWAVQDWLDRRGEWYRRRHETGDKCVRCGYDLRASRRRCPECGQGFWTFGD